MDQRGESEISHGHGEMAHRVRTYGWQDTAIGAPTAWSPLLHSMVDTLLAASVPMAVYWGPELLLIYNDAWRALIGGKHPHALGKPAREVFPEAWDVLAPSFAEALDHGRTVERRGQKVALQRYRDLDDAWFDYTFIPLYEPEGRIGGILNLATEITDRVRADQAQHESEARFRSVVDANIVGVAFGDPSTGVMHYGNDEYLRIVGRSRAELEAGRVNWKEFSDPATLEAEESLLREAPVGGRVGVLEKEYIHPDGSRVPVLITRSVLTPERDLAVAVVLDITDRRRAERALLHKSQELERSNQELNAFAAAVSHDLKAPLRAIAGLAAVIRSDAGDRLEAETLQQLRTIQARSERMGELIDGLLRTARLGAAAGEPRPVPLEPLLKELEEDLALPAGFRLQRAPELPVLEANPVHLRQVLQNLISNAVQHHDRSDGSVRVEVHDGGSHWRLVVADDGPGIPPEQRDGIFEMFVTSGSANGRSGIGLATVQKLVAANGGRVRMEPNTPRGSRFIVEWPKPAPPRAG